VETVRSWDGTTIAFDRSGRGPSLVIVGGALSDRGAVPELASRLSGELSYASGTTLTSGVRTEETPNERAARKMEGVQAT
jgi:hypothetical protein